MNAEIKKVAKDIRNEIRNAKGRRLDEKYVVIESDDWGSIRQPSELVFQEQVKRSGKEITDPFFRYDSIEKDEDLELLFSVLEKHKGSDGHPAIITADYAVANPKFESIRQSSFSAYSYESIATTYQNYSGSHNALNLAVQGIDRHVWMPQLHCREHVQVARWMDALRHNNPEIRWAFDHGMISTADAIEPLNHYAFMDAFNYCTDEYESVEEIVADAIEVFEKLFGFRSKTFVASCYVWNDCLERALRKHGIYSMQASWYQWVPDEKTAGRLEKKKLYMGMHSENQNYTVRNCLFEPSLFGPQNSLDSCMAQVASAFRYGQPAIISSHRVNYMSRIDKNNRDMNLKLLDELLRCIVRKWQDVKFVSSDTIASLYAEERNIFKDE